jgi:hypothetical protein
MFKYYPTDTHDGVELKAQKLLLSAPDGMRADRYAFRPCIQKKHPVRILAETPPTLIPTSDVMVKIYF